MAPVNNCNTCNIYDWIYNETKQQWECSKCGMAEVLQLNDVETWYEECMTDYDAALGELEYTKTLPSDGEAEKIVVLGKMKRAERKLAAASVRADAASMVQLLKNYSSTGEIILNLPEVQLNVKLQW